MSDLVITITDAGREEVINAVNTGTAPVLIASIGVGSGKYTPSPTQTALKTPIKTLTTFGGAAVSPDVIHVSIQDKSTDAYQMNEFGLFTDKGTLFAVYSHVDSVILEKTAKSILLLSTDVALKTLDATDITFGDTEFVNPPATETVKGVVELATDVETQTGTDKERVITPSSLKSLTASEERAGLIKIGSQEEVTAGTSTTLAVTPKTLKTAGDGRYLQKSEYLSEIEESGAAAQSSARGSLGLGTAATKNVGVASGNVMQVAAFGLGGGSNHKADAYNNVGEIYRVNSSSANTPTAGVAGVISLPCDGGPSAAYFAASNGGSAWIGYSNTPANGVKWFRIYTTEYKPSAADVDAYSKSESNGRFAYKSITINGKPLSSNVNLTAGDVNAWNKTESDGRYLKLIGGALTGPTSAPSFIGQKDGLRIHSDQEGTAQLIFANEAGDIIKGRFYPEATSDGHRMVLHAGANASNKGSYWIFQPNGSVIMPNSVVWAANGGSQGSIEAINFGTGSRLSIMQWNMATAGTWGMYLDHDSGRGIGFGVNGVIKAAGAIQSEGEVNSGGEISWNKGNCRAYGDGNISGPIWGGYLRDWLVNNTISRVLRGAQGSMAMDGDLVEAPAGCVLTGGNGNEGNQGGIALYRPLQIWRSGYWQTIEG